MKKLFSVVLAAVLACGSVTAQVLPASGVENTVWTGFGDPLEGDSVFYGVLDVIQARYDVGKFTIEGMLNWGALAEWSEDKTVSLFGFNIGKEGGYLDSFTFANTSRTPMGYHYGYFTERDSQYEVLTPKDLDGDNIPDEAYTTVYNGYKNGQTLTDSYYVNFLFHPIECLDVGLGTKLNWKVGPAPSFGAWLWESGCHVRQGGFSTSYDDRYGSYGDYQYAPDAPGSADVVGFVPYANKYAKKAIGVRYIHDGDFKFQVGGAIPNMTNTDHFVTNVGAQFQFEKFALAIAYEGLFQKDGNFYAGAEFGVSQFFFDVYYAMDGISNDDDENMGFSTGAAMTINIEKIGMKLVPESCINWFQNKDFTPAWYVGCSLDWGINERMGLGAYSSFAVGSRDKTWDDYDSTEDWGTGNVFTVRPEFRFNFNEQNRFAGYLNIEHREAFDNTSRWCWSTGAYWTYKIQVAGSTGSKSSATSGKKKSTKKKTTTKKK